MRNVTDRDSNPFGMAPPCERFVPGYGDPNADFHVIGDHPGVHGGGSSRIPFTETDAAQRLQRALAEAGLLAAAGTPPVVEKTFLSYLYACVPGDGEPTDGDYAALEPSFDAELRAITAHVLLPVGERPIRHVLATYTPRPVPEDVRPLHATEQPGNGFLVYPVADPGTWSEADEAALVAALRELRRTDFRREADLGRFLAGDGSYFVR